MAHTIKMEPSLRIRSHAQEKLMCRRITLATAWALVPFVLARRLWRSLARKSAQPAPLSLLGEARAEAGAIVPYIFMG